MSSLEQKVKQLEDASNAAQSHLAEKETKLYSATDALSETKEKLKALSPEAQQTLQVNDTELPELLSSKALAQEEYDEAKTRYEANQRYLLIIKAKLTSEK